MNLEIGDVVQSKSGGPEMAIQIIIEKTTNKSESFAYITEGYEEGDIVCQWFVENKLVTCVFKPGTLEKVA